MGTALEVRLSSATGSRISHHGDPIEGTIIAPVSVHGRIVVPQGSRLSGSIAKAIAIGFGIKHSTASLAYDFHTLRLPGGTTIPVHTQLVEVETAKEHVDAHGTVHGIHPIVSLSSSLAFYAVPFLLLDPAIGVPVWCFKSLVAQPANPEIVFPTGTELILRLTTSLAIPAARADFRAPPIQSFSQDALTYIEHLLKNSAQRAYMGNRPSDVVNVLLIGSRGQMDRAFHAAGWVQAQRKSPMSLYRIYDALTKRHGYRNAPMNNLTLNGAPYAVVHQKSLDTVEKRHHVRFWRYPGRANIWLGAAAEDVGFQFKLTHWTHATDPDIDTERAKVVNDLAFTGCVEAAGLVPRASAELALNPKAKHPILTDGEVAAIRLNACIHPHLMVGVGGTPALRRRRRVKNMLISLREELVRSNIIFTTYNTLKLLGKHNAKPTTTHAQLTDREPRGLSWLPPIAPSPQTLPARLSTPRPIAAAGYDRRR